MTSSSPPTQASSILADDEAIGRRLKEAREAREFTQQAVATRSKWVDPDGKGVSRTTLVAYEAGTSRPGLREIRILCETLFITPNYLIYGREEPLETKHTAMEALRVGAKPLDALLQMAVVLSALKGHERDAIQSLILSLAGRQLGDVRLAGLRTWAMLMKGDFEKWLVESAGPEAGTDGKLSVGLEELAELMSIGLASNLGTKVVLDEDGAADRGEALYPDPKAKS